MINLIPPHARKQVKIEYWVRVICVWVLLLAVAFAIVGLLLIPSLMLVRAQLDVYNDAYQTASTQNNVYNDLEKSVQQANTTAVRLATADTPFLFSKLIASLEDIAADTVLLRSISFIRNDQMIVEEINIVGTAKSRILLVQFKNALESNIFFESADVPLSNLAKDKDVPFSFKVIISNELYQ